MSSEDESEPKELAPGKLSWLSRPLFNAVGELYIDLSKKGARTEVTDRLCIALADYEHESLNINEVRAKLYHTFNDMETHGPSVSALSKHYNMSKQGNNAKLKQHIQSIFDQASHEEFVKGNSNAAVQLLRDAGLGRRALFSPEIKDIVEADDGLAADALAAVTEQRDILFKSTLKMVMSLARAHTRKLDGSVVEWQDLVQEGIIASLQAVDAYRPKLGDKGVTFTSYVYTTVSGIISKRVNETTRTVRVPRTNIDRFAHVSKAIDALHLSLPDIRGGHWQDGRLATGQVSNDTLTRIAEKATEIQNGKANFTAKEVMELLMDTQSIISMDIEVESDEDITEAVTFGETIADPGPSAEELLDGRRLKHNLMRMVHDYTVSPTEVKIMELRYGMGEVLSFRAVASKFAGDTGTPMNKGRAATIEGQVLGRIRRAMRNDPKAAKQFEELLRSTDSIPEN